MAIQQTGTPPNARRLGIFPHPNRKFVVILMILLILIAASVAILGKIFSWGSISDILAILVGAADLTIGVLQFWHPTRSNEANARVPLTPASPLPNAPPAIAPAFSSSIHSGGFPQRANIAPGIKLMYQERSNLTDALLEVYPNQEEFEIMFERRFERKLNTLVDGGNYWTRVYHLIERTEAENWTYFLILYAHEERPLNPALESWLQKYATSKVTPAAQQAIPIPPRIAEPPQHVQRITTEQERQQPSSSPDEQPLAKARKSFKEAYKEAYDAVNASKVIFAGRGDIQQIHYSQATAALGQVLSCIPNLQGLSQTFFPADRERLIMDLRRISTEVTESMKQIASYGTLDANQRESERKDTASRLSSILTQLDNLVGK